VVQLDLVVQRQRAIAIAPDVANLRLPFHHEGIDAQQPQPRGDREAVVPAPHHQHGRFAALVALLARSALAPGLAAEHALARAFGPALPHRLLVALQFAQRRAHHPGLLGLRGRQA